MKTAKDIFSLHEKMEDGSVNTEVNAPQGVEILIVREDAK